MSKPDYLVIDLEATCDDHGAVPKHEMEIIEIGAVVVDAETFEITGEFQTFVKPIRHPILTPFCTELTSITQADVDAAPTFPTALARLAEFMGERPLLFGSWGNYDRNQFELDAKLHGVALPFRGGHINIKERFSAGLGTKRGFGMARALQRLGLPLEGTHHRGIDDARNIARILPFAVGGAAIPGPGPGRGAGPRT